MAYAEERDEWFIQAIAPREPWQTCCGAGDICNTNQNCETVMTDSDVFGTNDRLGWTYANNDKKLQSKYRKRCVGVAMGAASAVYIVVLPILFMLVTLAGLCMVLAQGKGETKVFLPALLVVAFSCSLYFSEKWSSGLLAVLGSFTAIGAQNASSDYRHIVSVVLQFLIFAALCGDLGLGVLISNGGDGLLESAQGSNGPGWSAFAVCSNFYGYFNNPGNQPWNSEYSYQAYCSYGWLSSLTFFSVCLLGFHFLQMVASASLMMETK